MARKPKGISSHAVMAQRHEAIDSLDFFPTPPWASRALFEDVFFERQPLYVPPEDRVWQMRPWMGGKIVHRGPGPIAGISSWEPAAGEGHMAEVQKEYFGSVHASDVHDYGKGYSIGSFVGQGADIASPPSPADFIVTNPPFNLAVEFAHRAIAEAKIGVALLLRTVWVEGKERYEELFLPRPPDIIAQFSERVAMTKGEWNPEASTATAYAWFIWITDEAYRGLPATPGFSPTMWIPYGAKLRYTKPDDRARFAKPKPPTIIEPIGVDVTRELLWAPEGALGALL